MVHLSHHFLIAGDTVQTIPEVAGEPVSLVSRTYELLFLISCFPDSIK